MNILYSLSGYGYGHSSRARAIVPYLISKGHRVQLMTYGDSVKVLRKFDYNVFEIQGTRIHFMDGKINRFQTFLDGIYSFSANIANFSKFNELMKQKFDLIITDYEPVASYLSYFYHIPLISLDNQHLFNNCKINVPFSFLFDFYIAKIVTRLFVPKASYYIINNFVQLEIKRRLKNKTFIVPPIIRPEIERIKITTGKKILVYLSEKDDKVLEILKKISSKFVVYGYNIEKIEGNLIFHKAGERFSKDLAECHAVISTAGLSLISEAIFMKKPLLVLPLPGHFEQKMNSIFLRDSGFGDYADKLDRQKVIDFLDKTNEYTLKLKKFKFNNNLLFQKLDLVLKYTNKKHRI